MYLQNIIVSCGTFLFFAWLTYSGTQFPGVASYMPIFVGCMGMICSIASVVTVFLRRQRNREMGYAKAFPKKETLQIATALLLVSLYCLLMKYIGFVVTSFVFFFLFSLCFGPRDKKHIIQYILVSAVVVATIYFGFGVTLRTRFPSGILI